MMKILITSVGSLLGQNILESIESRRNLFEVIGINSTVGNTRNYRCDKVYLVSRTDSAFFEEDFLRIYNEEKPDFILPGGDGDSVFLSEIKSKYPKEFANKIPLGSSLIPRMMQDKYETHLFCKANHLPFADTFLYKNNADGDGLRFFIEKYGFPLIVKPRQGFGSHGVYFVLEDSQIEEFMKEDDVLFQEFLGNPEDIFKYKDIFKKGIPLFFQVPEESQYTAQFIIKADGTMSEVFVTINTMVFGRNEYIEQVFDKDIEQLATHFSKKFYENGWFGPVNIQLKQDRNGHWKVYELNSRNSGSTSARLLLGFDEIGLLTDAFIPEFKIPNLSQKIPVKGCVYKYLFDDLLLREDATELENSRKWEKR